MSASCSSRWETSTPASTSQRSRTTRCASRTTGAPSTSSCPHAEIFGARVDPTRSYVYDRDRGLIDRVASIFQDNPTSEQELYVLAEEKLMDAAEESPSIVARAERNTRLMLVGLLKALGFTSVSIEFVDVTP